MTGFVVPLSIFSHQPAEVTDQEKETGDNHFLFSVRGHLWRGDLVPVLLRLHLLHHCLCLHPQQVLLFSAREWSARWSFCFLILDCMKIIDKLPSVFLFLGKRKSCLIQTTSESASIDKDLTFQIHRAALLRPTRPRASWGAKGQSEKCEATSWKGGDERGLEHIFTLHILLERRTRRRFFPFIFSWEGGDEGGLENTFSPCILEKMVVVTFTLTLRETMVILILTLWWF